MLQESIGLSIILGFLASEFLGLSAGGLVSPGYLAFYLEQPLRLLSTMGLAIIIYFLVRILQRFMIIYGRRRFMAAVLLSLIGTWVFERVFFYADAIGEDIRVIGYIIPGLIANDMLKQGVAKTAAMVLLVAVIVRLVVMLLVVF
ncbi:MAG TPA: poly-gamma-glutamate biosynthesis protein PgsC [Rectinemataceae bacterium]|nr:poly-gamma-glutamate biosynthesis protein PgsC [Rectinemataceae bacterium]